MILISQIQHFFKELDTFAIFVNVLQICLLVFILYYLYRRFIRGTQSENLVRGSLVLVVMWAISELLIKEKTPERTLDGRGGRDAHVSPQVHQEYSYTRNSSHGAPAEHQQRTSDT